MSASWKQTSSPIHYARKLGERLQALGADVYASEKERYLVLLQNSPGEIIDLGRPLRSSRIFGHEAIRKNIPVVNDFSNFAKVDGLKDCMFWCIGLTAYNVIDFVDARLNYVSALLDFKLDTRNVVKLITTITT